MNKKSQLLWAVIVFAVILISVAMTDHLPFMDDLSVPKISMFDSNIPPSATATPAKPKLSAFPSLPLVTLQSKELPAPPFLVDWCEGEHCEESISLQVVCDANLHEQADETSPVIGKIVSGETLKDRTLFTKVLQVGSFDLGPNRRGQLVTFAGEGTWATFHDQKWDAREYPSEAAQKSALMEYPKTEPWILVQTQSGVTGFVEAFEGMDHNTCPLETLSVGD